MLSCIQIFCDQMNDFLIAFCALISMHKNREIKKFIIQFVLFPIFMLLFVSIFVCASPLFLLCINRLLFTLQNADVVNKNSSRLFFFSRSVLKFNSHQLQRLIIKLQLIRKFFLCVIVGDVPSCLIQTIMYSVNELNFCN